MKVIIRQVVEGRVEKAMQFEYEPYDILIEIGEQCFRIAQGGLALRVGAMAGRIVISPSSSNTVLVTEVK